MPEDRHTSATAASDAYTVLRKLGGEAHQLRAAVRAADHFLAADNSADHDTGSWLISSAFGLAAELAADLDSLAKGLKEKPGDTGLSQVLRGLRTRAHQLHAATRAADHFLDQDSSEDRDTGSWLIAYALGLADRLASEVDDAASALKKSGGDATATASDFSALSQSKRPAMAALRDVAA